MYIYIYIYIYILYIYIYIYIYIFPCNMLKVNINPNVYKEELAQNCKYRIINEI